MIARIDEFELSGWQRLSDWIHEWTGYDCIIQGRVSAALAAIALLVDIVQAVRLGKPFSWVDAFLLIANVTTAFWETDEDAAARMAAQSGFRNPRRVKGHAWRVFGSIACVMFFPLAIAHSDWAFGTWIFLTNSRDHLKTCDVQTARSGRIREALRELARPMIRLRA